MNLVMLENEKFLLESVPRFYREENHIVSCSLETFDEEYYEAFDGVIIPDNDLVQWYSEPKLVFLKQVIVFFREQQKEVIDASDLIYEKTYPIRFIRSVGKSYPKREINTFPASHIHKPERKTYADDIDSYNLGRGYGLELRRRRRDRRGIIM